MLFCFQDTKQLSQSFQVDLGGPLKNYFGAVTSEKIIENKVTPSSTSLFIRPNNEVWAGPVHLMAGIGFMEGSFHSGNNQEQLRELEYKTLNYQTTGRLSIETKDLFLEKITL